MSSSCSIFLAADFDNHLHQACATGDLEAAKSILSTYKDQLNLPARYKSTFRYTPLEIDVVK